MQWQAIVDFDGTISRQDTTDRILERFAEPGWEAIEADWVAGRIGSRDCMRRQVELLRVSPDVLDTFVATLEIDPGFARFVAACRENDIPVTIVSDGLDRTIQILLDREGLGDVPFHANHLEPLGNGRWRLRSPHAAPEGGCGSGTCKCRIASGLTRPLTLLVGDGRSDFCLAGESDLVFAKAGLLAHCRGTGLPHHAFADFTEATGLLDRLVAAPVAGNGRPELKDMIDG